MWYNVLYGLQPLLWDHSTTILTNVKERLGQNIKGRSYFKCISFFNNKEEQTTPSGCKNNVITELGRHASPLFTAED